MYNEPAQYKEMLIGWSLFVFIILFLAALYEIYELTKQLKEKDKLRDKQRSIIGFYRTYLLTRYGKAFDEDEELDLKYLKPDFNKMADEVAKKFNILGTKK